MAEEKKLILAQDSLKQFFYQHIDEINKKTLAPVPVEFILYSSEVLEHFMLSQNYFAGNKEKILGTSLLEAIELTPSEQRNIYKEVGDTVLFKLGLFSKSVDQKIVSKDYYLNLGKMAYKKMEHLDCSFYDIPNFYALLSSSLNEIVHLLEHSSESLTKNFETYLLESNKDLILKAS